MPYLVHYVEDEEVVSSQESIIVISAIYSAYSM